MGLLTLRILPSLSPCFLFLKVVSLRETGIFKVLLKQMAKLHASDYIAVSTQNPYVYKALLSVFGDKM